MKKKCAVLFLILLLPLNAYAEDKEIVTRTGQSTGLYVHENNPIQQYQSTMRMTNQTPGVSVDPYMASTGGRNLQTIGSGMQNSFFQLSNKLAARDLAAAASDFQLRLSNIQTSATLDKDCSELALIKYQGEIERAVSDSSRLVGRSGDRRRFTNQAKTNATILRNEILIEFSRKRKDAGLPEFDSSFIEKVIAGTVTNPGNSSVPFEGEVYFKKGEVDKALSYCNKAIETNKEDARAYSLRGFIYLTKGDLDGAMSDSSKAISINPIFSGGYNTRGAAYFEKGVFDKAISDYKTAIELDPLATIVYCNRGLAYYRLGQYEEALDDYMVFYVTGKLSKEDCRGAYDDFVKYAPNKAPTDTMDIRSQILGLLKEKMG